MAKNSLAPDGAIFLGLMERVSAYLTSEEVHMSMRSHFRAGINW